MPVSLPTSPHLFACLLTLCELKSCCRPHLVEAMSPVCLAGPLKSVIKSVWNGGGQVYWRSTTALPSHYLHCFHDISVSVSGCHSISPCNRLKCVLYCVLQESDTAPDGGITTALLLRHLFSITSAAVCARVALATVLSVSCFHCLSHSHNLWCRARALSQTLQKSLRTSLLSTT